MALFHFGTIAVDFSKYAGTYVRIQVSRNDVIATLRHVNVEGDSYLSKLEQNDVVSAIEMATLMNVPVEIESIEQGV
ncbi:hypothetical protein [Eikenella longinqua]|uniref:hypothetical protein n=1 Tax=Eikenella longinqua TaxID=1795827 RepID=UPI000B1C7D8C|nr:hypothetical protein [Eikenella longinqua]